MISRPQALNLSNWRAPGHGSWAFHHVREVVPSERIDCASQPAALASGSCESIGEISVDGLDSATWSLPEWLEVTSGDALLVAHRGRLVHEWYVNPAIERNPHIIFSVSKSVTATLAGVLVEQGTLDPARGVVEYLPELADSAYGDASVQQVLDMQISVDFSEDYLATSGLFVEYRTATAWHPCEVADIDSNLHDFLARLQKADGEHGYRFEYKSPNSDLLGWLLERASGERLADLMSRCLWQPMGAEADAYITVDRKGNPRTAGGICVLPRDLLRLAELVRNRGRANGEQVIPEAWIADCFDGGSVEAWERGESAKEFPRGSYRNKWYQTGNEHRALMAIGIHGQWIYIDPVNEVSVIKLSSQNEPLRYDLDNINFQAFARISAACAAG